MAEEALNKADFFLNEPSSAKISQNGPPKPPRIVKEEMQILTVTKKTQDSIMDTLKYIHGKDFTLSKIDDYEDKGLNLTSKYWTGQRNLIIKGVTDYSNVSKEPENENDRLKMFAVLRLESYGFHPEHCQEALEHCDDVEKALSLLYEKYLKIERTAIDSAEYSENELLEQRLDEKGVLESIYESSFQEKVKNCVWIINCKLDYLVSLYTEKKERVPSYVRKRPAKKIEKCRNYWGKKTCQYGANCRFVHELPEEPKPDVNAHLYDYNFEIEIRFSEGTKYPLEPPLIFLKTNAVLPKLLNLHICKRLYKEAETFAADGIASIYAIIELLNDGETMTEYLKSTKISFLDRDEKLFPKIEDFDASRLNRATHYMKGSTGKNSRKVLSIKDIRIEDRKLAENFKTKLADQKYKKMQEVRRSLPAYGHKSIILEAVEKSQIIVISGETGCGKSTQVPQYILEEWQKNYNDNHVEIICTQPRRISAIGVAERVAAERAERIGNVIGYQIRLESKVSASTRLHFCTTGILLRKMENDPLLSNVTHIVVDEVHERSEESDFLLLLLRELMPLRPDLKVILMSATLNAAIFSDYFGEVPVIEIPGRTFPVEQLFLEDILEISDFVLDPDASSTRNIKTLELEIENCDVTVGKPRDVVRDEHLNLAELVARYTGYSFTTCKNMYLLDPDKVNLDLIECVLMWIVSANHDYPTVGSILVFLPGISEIMALYDQLVCHPEFNPKHGKYVLLPLHSSLSSEEQSLIFEKPKNRNARKIILSTNIAETSVTIDDCVFVIDSGKMKEKHFDSNRNMESLEMVWVTRANALQRKGRAGRVQEGVCIHLFTSHRFKHHFLGQPIPEIHRIPLEQVVLNIKVQPNFKGKDVYRVLGNIIEPPVKESIDSSIIRLQNVGALDSDSNLTPLGYHLALLPVDVRIGKLMLFGAIFSCLDSTLTIAASLSNKSPFLTPFGKKEQAYKKKLTFSTGVGDQMTVLNAYNRFQQMNKKGYVAGLNFAKENYLHHKTLQTIADIKYQFLELLVNIGFVPVDLGRKPRSGEDNILTLTGEEFNSNGSNVKILSSLLCAALYPNVVKVLQPEKSYVASSVGAVRKQFTSKDFKFRTKQEQVFVHPSSVVFDIKQFTSPFVIYQEKVKTTKIFIRDCCVLPIVPLVLFSGFNININVHGGSTFIALDDKWIIFKVDEHKVAEMIKLIRIELLKLLEEKIRDPLLNIHHHDQGEKIISSILQLVTDG